MAKGKREAAIVHLSSGKELYNNRAMLGFGLGTSFDYGLGMKKNLWAVSLFS